MRGECVICGKNVSLRGDGTLRGDGLRPPGNVMEWCEGSWRLPKPTEPVPREGQG